MSYHRTPAFHAASIVAWASSSVTTSNSLPSGTPPIPNLKGGLYCPLPLLPEVCAIRVPPAISAMSDGEAASGRNLVAATMVAPLRVMLRNSLLVFITVVLLVSIRKLSFNRMDAGNQIGLPARSPSIWSVVLKLPSQRCKQEKIRNQRGHTSWRY